MSTTGEVLTDSERSAIIYFNRVGRAGDLAARAGVSLAILGDAVAAWPLPANTIASVRRALRESLS